MDPIQAEASLTETGGMPLLPSVAVPAEVAWVFWAVLLLPLLALLVGVSVRRVGRDELVLVVRRGRVIRSASTGWLARVPGPERFVAVPTHRQVLPLVLRGRTRDGVDIVALADLTLVVEGVPDAAAYDDPASAAARVAEQVVAEALGGFAAVTLLDELADLEVGLPEAITRRSVPGTVVTALVVTEIQAQLTPRLARALRTDVDTRS